MILFFILGIFFISSCSLPQPNRAAYSQPKEEEVVGVDSISSIPTPEAEEGPLFVYSQNPGTFEIRPEEGLFGLDFQNNLRLTGIIQDKKPLAIIEIYGKSYVVEVGERVEDYFVKSIRMNTVVITWGSKEIKLTLGENENRYDSK